MAQASMADAEAELDRLFGRTRLSGECMEWAGSRDGAGYGRVRRGGHVKAAHRLVFQLTHSVELDRKQYVCHSCDNPPCINPEHLWLGDNVSNQQDCVYKDRSALAKLTASQAREIRERYWSSGRGRHAKGNAGDLAVEFGVSKATIQFIAAKRTWAAL